MAGQPALVEASVLQIGNVRLQANGCSHVTVNAGMPLDASFRSSLAVL